MTQYTENLWGSSDGVYPTSILTKRWVTTNETNVHCHANSEAQGNFAMRLDWSVAARRLQSLDAVDGDANRANVELLVRFQLNEALGDHQFGVCGRASGTGTDETAYEAMTYETSAGQMQVRLLRVVDGAGVFIAQSVPFVVERLSQWNYMRFRINGSDLKAKIWSINDHEPVDWSVEATDTNITGVGWSGLWGFRNSGDTSCDFLSIGTNGDSPSIPVGDPTDPIRITGGYAGVLRTNPDAPIRVSAAYTGVLSTNPNAPIRVTGAYLAVLHQAPNLQTALLPATTITLTLAVPLAMVAQNFSILPSASILLTPNNPTVMATGIAETKVKVAGTWELQTAPEVMVGAAWEAVTFIEVKRNGSWEVVFEL